MSWSSFWVNCSQRNGVPGLYSGFFMTHSQYKSR